MSLLNQETLAEAIAIAQSHVARRVDALREAYWGPDTSQTPVGLQRLKTPEERDVWKRFIARQAIQEQDGFVESDIATTIAQHPDVRREFSATGAAPEGDDV